MVELRLDLLENLDDWEHLAKYCSLPKIITCRPQWEGGNYSGSESRRLSILRQACSWHCEYVDVELKAAPSFHKPLDSKTVSNRWSDWFVLRIGRN